jgi:iron complex outermembrane receptor protein
MTAVGWAQAGGQSATGAPADGQGQQPATAEPAQAGAAQVGAAKPEEAAETSIVVSARRVEEEAQDVPIPVSVVNGRMVESAGAFNVNRLKELVPTVQFYSSNPRNTSVNIRGLGSPFGLTNDGIEPGVGFYVDGVYYSRPAAGTLDFLDVEQIEVLRGPQGTLFGKNTTAGSINIKTRRPSFTPQTNFELNYGNYGFVQAKASVSGPIRNNIAARLSFSGTQRDGTLVNVARNDDVNDLNNVGLRAQFLITLAGKIVITPSVDYSRQRPEGYAQLVAGVAPTLRAANRQYAQIAADLGYAPPSFNAFDRLVDSDTPWRSDQSLGGASVNVDWDLGSGILTSTTAWRSWAWRPSNDRDFIGLPVTTLSQAPSDHTQWTQEIRYAGKASSNLNVVLGAFLFGQDLRSAPFHTQEQGAAAARFLLAPSAQANTPGLLDGYGQKVDLSLTSTSAALFGQVEWTLAGRLRVIPGLRLNYDKKDMSYDAQTYGGLQTSDAALVALQRSILAPQAYAADVNDTNLSGQLTLAYQVAENANTYVTYSTSFKSVGLNLGGVPSDAAGNPALGAATVRPEGVHHLEFGVKTQPTANVTANLTVFNTDIRDFQTQVVNAQVGVLRGYLANASKVRVRGIEFDGNAKAGKHFSAYASVALTDGRYTSFTDAPPPVEETGGPQVKDVSGTTLPGISKWAFSYGGEAVRAGNLMGQKGEFFAAIDSSYRSAFSSSPSASRYMAIGAYALLNARIGFRGSDNWAVSVWGRNLLQRNYFELLSAAPGGSGLIVGLPGDPRTFGLTLRRAF